jgi:hypothetical protein
LQSHTLKSVCQSSILDLKVQGGENFLEQKNEEVLITTTGEGDTSFMVCRTDEESKGQKVCMYVENAKATALANQSSSEKRMLDNNTYDLMEQLLIENKSLWRIKNNYKNDAAMDNEAKQLWSVIEKEKEDLVSMLTEKLKERL